MRKSITVLSIIVVCLTIIGMTAYLVFKAYLTSGMMCLPTPDSSDCYYGDGFQDYTDYCKYYYAEPEAVLQALKSNPYFKPVTAADIAELDKCFEDFEGWVELVEYKDAYDFQRSCIDTQDYFYIEDKEKSSEHPDLYFSYDIYFFDTQTATLFYIHNNV